MTQASKRTDRLTVAAWALWDWGSAAFNAVLVTFIFSVYLTDSVGQQIDSQFTPAQWLSWSMTVAGLVIFAVTPVMGQRSDRLGTRRRALGFWSLLTFLVMASLFFIRNDAPVYFWLGLIGLAVGSVTIQFAEVNYFAQLNQVATEDKVGRVSGLGWSAGYFGGIVLLLICYFGFVSGEGGGLGLSTEGGWNIRLVALLSAAWFGLSAIPVLLRVPEIAPSGESTGGVAESYRELWRTVHTLWREDRNAFAFLFASAIFRDGLSAVFSFGAVLGVSVYGLSPGDVLIFGVAANAFEILIHAGCGSQCYTIDIIDQLCIDVLCRTVNAQTGTLRSTGDLRPNSCVSFCSGFLAIHLFNHSGLLLSAYFLPLPALPSLRMIRSST